MRRALAALVVLAAVSAPATLLADGGGRKFALHVRPRWKAGDLVTKTEREDGHQDARLATDAADLKSFKVSTVTAVTRVDACDEADADGRWRRGTSTFTVWSQKQADTEDTSLLGVRIEWTSGPEGRRWKQVGEAKEITAAATAWLDKHFGAESSDDVRDEALEPTAPLAVGESWKADVGRWAGGLVKRFRVDAAKSTVEGTLEQVNGDEATYVVRVDVASSEILDPFTGSWEKWLEGGPIHAQVRVTARLDGRVGASKQTTSFDVKGVADASASATGAKFVLDAGSSFGIDVRLGQAMPTPPAK